MVAATIAYLILAVLFTWPLAAQIGTSVPYYNDTWIFVWDVAHVRAALLDPARHVWETTDVFHPGGISLAYHTLAPLYGLIALPVVPLVGLIAAYNLFVLATFVLSGLAMHAFARAETGSSGAAFAAGAVFTLSPYHQIHAPHLNLLSLQFLPLSAWAMSRFLRTGSWRHALAVAVSAVLSFYACHEYVFFTAVLCVVLFGHALTLRQRDPAALAPLDDVIGRGAGAAAVGLGLAAPGLLPMLAEAAVERHYDEAVDIWFAADVFSWITPSVRHSLWGGYTMKVYQYFPGVMAEWTTYLGVGVAAFILLAIGARRRRPVARWLLVAIVFGLLAMGPRLRVLGKALPVPLPYAALKKVPVLAALREPARFAAGVTLATSMLVAYGWVALRESRHRRLAPVLLAVALIDFVQVPMPVSSAETSSFLDRLGQDDADYAVLDVPAGLEFREHLYHQTVHGKRIFLGYVARIPAAQRRFIAALPLLRDPVDWPASADHLASLSRSARRHGVRYALVHRQFYERRGTPDRFGGAVDRLLELPGARIVHRDEGLVAVRLDGR